MKNSDDFDRSLLTVIPEAARVHQQGFPPHFSWDFLPAKFFESPTVPIKASQSVFNLSTNNENKMKPSNSAFEILSRTESHEDLTVNEPIKEEQISQNVLDTAKDLNNNSARSLRSPELNEYLDNERDQDTETLVSEQKFNGQQHHEFTDTDNVSLFIFPRSVCVVSLCVLSSIKLISLMTI